MKIEIDKFGHLNLERGGKMKGQFCPHDRNLSNACGDWCPLFREPDIGENIVEIGLCECYIHCKPEEFTDRRGK